VIDELAVWEQIAFVSALMVIVINLVWVIWLFARARTATDPGSGSGTAVGDDAADAFTWVFLVPALNEEVTIADSVHRLEQVQCRRRHIIVVDDASTDATPDVLAAIDHPDLHVIRREPPRAQLGKADALNDAWARLPDVIGPCDRATTIVCIVDADGRLDPDAPAAVAEHFTDPEVGGVQVRVHIYNNTSALTRAQDTEFGVYGELFQAGRTTLGTAGMGGNGQFNRLAALDDVADTSGGPWHHTLTEDQDIGLRLLAAGWQCHHDNRVGVHQQGLNDVRRLLRQRTRWAQGNLQAMSHLPRVHRYPLSRRARLDLTWALLQPVAAMIVGVGFIAAVWAYVTRGVPILPQTVLLIVVFAVLGFGGLAIGVSARTGRGPRAWIVGGAHALVYSTYTWLLWPIMLRATWRLVRAKSTWAKTEREAI
jgi:cellulose synthase/poly-beta-1,6-N-acetylglucosamine synthase-like glycosyltransferase